MLARRRARQLLLQASQNTPAVKPCPLPLLTHPPSRSLPPSIYTDDPQYLSLGETYDVFLYDVVEQRGFIETYYPRQILELYDGICAEEQRRLWSACILYRQGGICLLASVIDLSTSVVDLSISVVDPTMFGVESDEIGSVTVAAAGSEIARSHILRTFLNWKMGAIVSYDPTLSTSLTGDSPCVCLYILCHNKERFHDAQIRYDSYPWATPILMKYQDSTFENAFWKQLGEIKEEWTDCEMVGTLSYKAFEKIDLNHVDRIIRDRSQWRSGYYNFMETDEPIRNDHPHLLTIIRDVLKELRLPEPKGAYCNYWMCTPHKMRGFLQWYEEILKPVVLKHPLVQTDSGYHVHNKMDLIKLWGHPYYPHTPFVFERLNVCYFRKVTVPLTTLYLIGGVDGGGSLKFIHDFIEQFPHTQRITYRKDLESTVINTMDTLVIQHLVQDITPADLCKLQQRTGCRLILNIHDFWWLNKASPHNAYLASSVTIDPSIKELFRIAELVIHPSQFTFGEYAKYFSTANFAVSPHIDFADMNFTLAIPPIRGVINIGCMHTFSEYKGKEYISFLMNTYKKYKNYTINFIIAGVNTKAYVENEFFEFIKEKEIHCLLLLNKWGETYCYSLSKFLKSGLPILYNSIGATAERIPDRPYYIQVFDSVRAFDGDAKNLLVRQFESMINMIIEADKVTGTPCTNLTIQVPPLYDYVFNSNANKYIMEKIHRQIKPFCIYFPQFHRLVENDHNYYPGMTDTNNLMAYLEDTKSATFDTPAICALKDYDLSRKELVLKQVQVAKEHGIYGFCVYYYWFSHNSLSGKHTIMERCYDHFFAEPIEGFKVYFNWANEDWTKNPAFTLDSSVTISNIYTEDWIRLNFVNLSRYFAHPNYYKIDGAPVFSIHHPWFMNEAELAQLERIFSEECKALGFPGIHILKNSMVQKYNNSFLIAPNYKARRTSTDYVTYIPDTIAGDTVHTMFFSFDNTARMYKPKKPYCSKITNVSPTVQLRLLSALLKSYKGGHRSELQKLFLINSWNEWGENMAVEPGMKNGSFYLDMIKRGLLQVI